MTTREIADTMHQLYEVEVSHELISHVTESVQNDVAAWQSRPLEAAYPVLFMDGLVVSIRSEGKIVKHTVYLAIAEAEKKWTMPIHHWSMALQQFAIKFEDRLPLHLLNHTK